MNSINLGFDIGVNTDVGPSLLRSDLLQHSKDKLSLFMGSLKWGPQKLNPIFFCGVLIYFEEVIVGEIEKASVTAGAFLLSRPV